jgi:hypothetical protein
MELIRANKSLLVDIETRAFPGEAFKGYISFTDPFLNPQTRTVRVRVNIENPDLKLKPDMFARAKIRFPVGEMLAVPENAVIHSGTRKIVLVEEEKGKFTPKLVKLGRLWLNDLERETAEEKSLDFQSESLRYHEVIAGLAGGDQIVTSGNFLLGSESQLQGALVKMLEESGLTGEGDGTSKGIVLDAEEEGFALLLESYLGIAGKLANDTVAGIPALAEKITINAQNPAIKQAAEPLRHGGNDIKAVREDFKQMSNVMIAYISVHRAHMKDVPNRVHCPMAGPNGADWVQIGTVIANPYFGAEMPRCGNIQKWD